MDENVKRLVEKYGSMTPYEKLALTDEQKLAVEELEAAIKKCREANVGFVQTDYACYAYNDEDVYDIDCTYDDYSVCDINLTKLQRVSWNGHEVWSGKSECAVAFYSMTFPEPGT